MPNEGTALDTCVTRFFDGTRINVLLRLSVHLLYCTQRIRNHGSAILREAAGDYEATEIEYAEHMMPMSAESTQPRAQNRMVLELFGE